MHVQDDDKLTILKHMYETGSAWLDAKKFEKHNNSIPPEFAQLLGDASGPKKKAAKKSIWRFVRAIIILLTNILR